jgi:hypothetical protein
VYVVVVVDVAAPGVAAGAEPPVELAPAVAFATTPSVPRTTWIRVEPATNLGVDPGR